MWTGEAPAWSHKPNDVGSTPTIATKQNLKICFSLD